MHFGIVGVQLIAGQLLDDETIVRFVIIEGADDIIAIAPGVRPFIIVGESVRIGISNHVEPMLAPLLTIARTIQKTFYDLLEGFWRLVFHKGVDFRRRRRQAGEIKGCPSNKCDLFCRTGGSDAFFLQLFIDKGIDRIAGRCHG